MKLTLEQIKNITLGASRVREIDGDVRFYRFTEEQEELYRGYNDGFYTKSFATSGVRLRFKTDSRTLALSAGCIVASTRKYNAFDIFVNGTLSLSINNFDGTEYPAKFAEYGFEAKDVYEGSLELGEGTNEVEIYLPWSSATVLHSIELDDGASLIPVRPEKRMITFGDSITQGYDALHPSNRYAAKLANYLGAEERCKAIGGDVFYPDFAKLADEGYNPDYISVAYGTNDWSHGSTRDVMVNSCREFYAALAKTYPNAKIIAMAPIWRKDYEKTVPFGKFAEVAELIEDAVSSIPGAVFVNAFEFVPFDEKYFADLRLHPNDEGFDHYAKNLCAKLKEMGI